MQVHRNEGVAIHIGPESCAGGREAVREALTGERVGQPLNRENDASRVPTCEAAPKVDPLLEKEDPLVERHKMEIRWGHDRRR